MKNVTKALREELIAAYGIVDFLTDGEEGDWAEVARDLVWTVARAAGIKTKRLHEASKSIAWNHEHELVGRAWAARELMMRMWHAHGVMLGSSASLAVRSAMLERWP